MKFLIINGLLLTLCLSSCVLRRSHDDDGTLVRSAVVEVAADYLKFVVLADRDVVAGKILWAEYLLQDDKQITKDDFFAQLHSMKSLAKATDHPLLGLTVIDVDVDGDNAEVILHNDRIPNSDKITVRLTWAGQGWLVVDDSLFGRKGYIAKLLSVPATQQEG